MKYILLLALFPCVLFSQSLFQERSSFSCDSKIDKYNLAINQKNVFVEDKNIKEIASGLSTLGIQKRIVMANDTKEVFLYFKVYTFPTLNSSKYLFHENSMSIDEAKSFLLDLVKMEEEFNKMDASTEHIVLGKFSNSENFIRSGYEFLQVKDKTISGLVKRDINGDEMYKTEKKWFFDIDTSCKDKSTTYTISNILEFIEILRIAIN